MQPIIERYWFEIAQILIAMCTDINIHAQVQGNMKVSIRVFQKEMLHSLHVVDGC